MPPGREGGREGERIIMITHNPRWGEDPLMVVKPKTVTGVKLRKKREEGPLPKG